MHAKDRAVRGRGCGGDGGDAEGGEAMKVKITKVIGSNDDNEGAIVEVRVHIDGADIGTGRFGGEPEDNYEFRQYKWVMPLIQALAAKLGDVEIVEETEED
jgi:hypothetical protein